MVTDKEIYINVDALKSGFQFKNTNNVEKIEKKRLYVKKNYVYLRDLEKPMKIIKI